MSEKLKQGNGGSRNPKQDDNGGFSYDDDEKFHHFEEKFHMFEGEVSGPLRKKSYASDGRIISYNADSEKIINIKVRNFFSRNEQTIDKTDPAIKFVEDTVTSLPFSRLMLPITGPFTAPISTSVKSKASKSFKEIRNNDFINKEVTNLKDNPFVGLIDRKLSDTTEPTKFAKTVKSALFSSSVESAINTKRNPKKQSLTKSMKDCSLGIDNTDPENPQFKDAIECGKEVINNKFEEKKQSISNLLKFIRKGSN